MKTTAKQSSPVSESSDSRPSVKSQSMEQSPRGKQAGTGGVETSPASSNPMESTFIGFDMVHKRLRANGFMVPKMRFLRSKSASTESIVAFTPQMPTPKSANDSALEWFVAFYIRAMNPGGVENIKSRIKFDTTAIWRWAKTAR